MIKIYNAQDINEAHILKGLLEANNINAFVNGYYLQGGIGEIAPADFASISVEMDQAEAALDVIQTYENTNPQKKFSSDAVNLTNSKPSPINKGLIYIPIIIVIFFIITLFSTQ